MAIIWTIEDDAQQPHKLFSPLSMNFPVRRIASTKTFLQVLEMETKQRFPSLVIVNDISTSDELLIYRCFSILQQNRQFFQFLVSNSSSTQWKSVCARNQLDTINLADHDSFGLKLAIDQFLNQQNSYTQTDILSKNSDALEFGDVRLEKGTCEIEVNGSPKDVLSPKELKILELLIANSNTCVLRKSLAEYVWPKTKISERTMDSHISRLRRKLEKSLLCSLESVYGKGYCLKYR